MSRGRFLGHALGAIAVALLIAATVLSATRAAEPSTTKAVSTPIGPRTFESARKAADAMVEAAEKFDEAALLQLVGPQGRDMILTGEYAQDRERAQQFAAQARKKLQVTVDPKTDTRAYLLVGEESWPFSIPILKHDGRWAFDANAGRQELLFRRIGSNELDAIEICEGYVDAQFGYAYRKRELYAAPQYAQQIIATSGKEDGLAWQKQDGTWDGPIGEKIARAIEQGYDLKAEPYHGYFFKVLKGQGASAPLGAMDYVIEGVLIGGFALVAAPAEYGETGLKTFMVSQTGVVYEKDLGPDTLTEFQKMERFNPDNSWKIVSHEGSTTSK